MYEKELRDYKEQGFCKVDGLFSESEVSQILEEINAFIQSEAKKLGGRNINFTDGQVNSIHALVGSNDDFFARLMNSERIKKFAATFLEDDAVSRGAELFAKPARVGLPSPWHQDNAYWCVNDANALTIWVALDHCDQSNGSVTYYSGSHKLGLVDHKPSFAPGSSQTIADENLLQSLEKDKVSLNLRPGDALVHHCLTIHGSPANKSDRPRRGMTMQFLGKKSGYDLAMKARYEASLAEQVRLREQAKNSQVS